MRAARTAFIALFVLLAGCSGAPPQPVAPAAPQVTAEQSFQRGDYQRAAQLWQQRAMAESPANASRLRVLAADAWLLAGAQDSAADQLAWVDETVLSPGDLARMRLVQTELALLEGNTDAAAGWLQQAQPGLASTGSTDLVERWAVLDSQLRQLLSAPVSADLAELSRAIGQMSGYQVEAALDLLKQLESIPGSDLQVAAASPRNADSVTGWLELAVVLRNTLLKPEELPTGLEAWQERHPVHPLTIDDAIDLSVRYRNTFSPPGTVTALLPERGRLLAAADAIRDGLLSSFMAQPGDSQLLMVDSGEEPESAPAAYFSAREAGAEFLLGPIQPEAVAALLRLSAFDTPALALNEIPADYLPPPQLIGRVAGISLSQDEEVRAIAAEMALRGFASLLVLVPDDPWGERVLQAFSEEFLQQDRQIALVARYLPDDNDHSPAMERWLKIDESQARKRSLENTLQIPLEFEPVRRDDIDAIFIAANPAQGQSLRPQLRFHDAGDLPVYATGRIFSGQPDPVRDQDLNGVRIPIAPIQAGIRREQELPPVESIRGGRFLPLYALGADAWNLIPWLELMRSDPDFHFPGLAGTYSFDASQRIKRRPAFAEFRNGVPQLMDPPPTLSDSQATGQPEQVAAPLQ